MILGNKMQFKSKKAFARGGAFLLLIGKRIKRI